MSAHRHDRLGWLAGSVMAFVAAACGPAGDQAGKSDTGAMGAAGATTMTAIKTGFRGRCGNGVDPDCSGELKNMPTGWSGTMGTLPRPLAANAVAKFAAVTFDAGSLVAVPRKPVTGNALWTSIESIKDAHLVSTEETRNPVIVARLLHAGGDLASEDARYGVKRGATYYFVVLPDTADGSADGKSPWFIVEYRRVGNAGQIVREGADYQPCTDSAGKPHDQKAAPFAWFVACPLANEYSFESLIAAKAGAAADSASKQALLTSISPQLRAAMMRTLDNDDPIWITCGLGCCSTGAN